jgi:hypothetical protein
MKQRPNRDEDVESSDSEEEAMRGKQDKRKFKGEKQHDDEANKLRLSEFHRLAGNKQKHRKPTLKKRVRDIKRMIERQGLPEEIK